MHAYSNGHYNRSRCDGNRGEMENCVRVSGHGFSSNGYEWNMSSIEPYNYLVHYTDGSIQEMPTMERPKLVIDPLTKEPSHLVTATQYDSNNESRVWPCSVGECVGAIVPGVPSWACAKGTWVSAPGTCGCQFCKTTGPMDQFVFTLSRPLRAKHDDLTSSKMSRGVNQHAAKADEYSSSSHRLKLGFNVGYLSDSQYYAKAFRRIAADGIAHTRFMGPFLHPPGHAAERRETFTSALIENVSKLMGDSSTITLSLSDFPFDVVDDLLEHPSKYLSVWPKPWQPGEPENATLADTLRYTNRAPPTRGAWAGNATLADYFAILRKLRRLLGPSADFEIANEPNALSYFWGNAADFSPIADGTLSALADPSLPAPPSRVTCCAFATEMGCQGIPHGSDNGFMALAQQVTARHAHAAAGRFATALSWHFYRRVSHDSDPARSTFANATAFYGRDALQNSVLSEWGLSTFNSAESSARINSPELMMELVRVLAFAAEVGLAELDAHCLMDHPHKGGHDCYFDRFGEPRASYFHYALVARVIRGGYTVGGGGERLTNISGVSSGLQILAAAGDPDGRGATDAPFTLPFGYGVVAASSGSGFASSGQMLRAGEWVVIQAEPTLACKLDDADTPKAALTLPL